jgi:hypothetical protein
VQLFLTSVASLTSQTDNWVIHAKIVEKTDVRRWDLGRTSGQLFHIVLEDKSGAIRATIFDSAVEKFYYILELNKHYAISNAKIRRKPDYSFEMTITESSHVTPLSTPEGPAAHSTPSSSKNPPATPEQYLPSTSPNNPIRSILKIPSDEELNRPILTHPPKSILKNSGDEDITFFSERFSENNDQTSFLNRYRTKEMEEGEEEDHGFRVTKKVGFKDPEPILPKKVVGFKEDVEEDDYFLIPRSSTPKTPMDAKESDSTGSTEHQQPSPAGLNFASSKKKSVSFKTPSDDEEENILELLRDDRKSKKTTPQIDPELLRDDRSSKNTLLEIDSMDPELLRNDYSKKTPAEIYDWMGTDVLRDDREGSNFSPAATSLPEESEKKTFNLSKYFY